MRQRIAANLRAARDTAAHVWTSVEVDFERVERARQGHRSAFKATEGFSLTYLPFIARATMDALRAHPVVNSRFDIDRGTWTFHRGVNLGIAVDLNQEGLVVVNIQDADGMTLTGLARAIRGAAVAARDREVGPDDLTGFSFSITNPGPFGSFMSAPIIPQPNAAILSTDTITKKPVVVEMPDGSDAIAIHHVGYLGLSWDHRVFDGSTAVLFLDRIKQNLQNWDWEQELS
jgi:2-oxoglutarate dehydrogenase E2 component (dihydrolipoamide succinyltransferase)